MALYLGIDTSNYTTSCALYNDATGEVVPKKQLLPVAQGSLGLRQSDAVFHHVKQLPPLLESLLSDREQVSAVGVSAYPRDEKGSYMPCFLSGMLSARSIAAALQVPMHSFSHQAGHVFAALYDTKRLHITDKPFIAFHYSGGTTECLRCAPDPLHIVSISKIAGTLDLNAGQVVDRVGGMLGLPFPAGPYLEELAKDSLRKFQPKVSFKGQDCCLSGVENQCRTMLEKGEAPCDIAMYCLEFLKDVVVQMAQDATDSNPGLPLIFAGGVMSNQYIKNKVLGQFPGAAFASPTFSADNAAGTAVLSGIRHRQEMKG